MASIPQDVPSMLPQVLRLLEIAERRVRSRLVYARVQWLSHSIPMR